VTSEGDEGLRELLFDADEPLEDALSRLGEPPLPPYVRRKPAPEDRERYQTVYARRNGAVAAPTAGLHFDAPMLARLQAEGVAIVYLTLHVGLGTFRPVAVEDAEDHVMHSEPYHVSLEAAEAVNNVGAAGGRIVAVGTTVARTLETVADSAGRIHAAEGETDIFITPGYRFRAVDALLTNFHLPRSTLLMMVSAFAGRPFGSAAGRPFGSAAGREFILDAYRQAIAERYRFFSYGDCMLIL
jgi:S-adenosylmethionine:tRNA ribosyltransferase-isomerase